VDGHELPQGPCAVITAHGNVESAVRALEAGRLRLRLQALDLGVLRRIVSTALKLSQSADAAPRRAPARSSSAAPAMERLREMILRVARSQAPVHISGESGTGKELVARMIHGSGPRAEGPFVPVNCGAIPSELMESEFFGHKRGSFTGAVSDKDGLFQSAEGGTLFLDEWPTCRCTCRSSCCASSRKRPCGRSASSAKQPSTCASCRPRTRTSSTWWPSQIPRRPVLPHQRHRDPRAAAARAAQRHPAAGRGHPGRLEKRIGSPTSAQHRGLARARDLRLPGNVRELENVLERAVTLSGSGMVEAEHIRLRAVPRVGAAPAPQAATAHADASGA
jgi:two-component system response regulator PilR (NtrC family)